MALPKISELSSTSVEDNLQLLSEVLQAEMPSADFSPGTVFYQLLLRPAAIMQTAMQAVIAQTIASGSLYEIANNPDLTDDVLVDRVLSNFRVTRRTGTLAGGMVTIITQTNDYLPVSTSTIFSSGTTQFRPTAAYAGVPDASSVTGNTDIIFHALSNGQGYAITINVAAIAAGSAGNLAVGTRLDVAPSLPGQVIDIYAAGEFSGGSDTETTTQLIDRLNSGIANSSASNRASIRAMLIDNFPEVSDVSVVGAGDAELVRSSRLNALGVKMPGYADIYVRTRSRPAVETVTMDAVLVNVAEHLWALSIPSNTYPGLYRAEVRSPSGSIADSPLEVVTDSRTFDALASTIDYKPMLNDVDAIFTRYQGVSMVVKDPHTPAEYSTVGVKRSFSVTITYMPNLDLISDWMLDRDQRPVNGHYIVRAPFPCFTAVSIRVIKGQTAGAVLASDIQTWKAAVAQTVNGVKFVDGQLDGSIIVSALHKLLPAGYRIQLPMDLQGTVIGADGKARPLVGQNRLVPPSIPDQMISPRTVAFYSNESAIGIEVVASDALPV